MATTTTPSATMFPGFVAGTIDRTLASDDIIGISSLYDTWQQLPGAAIDIAASGSGAWVIGTGAVFGGNTIHKWNGSGWDLADGGGVRIAVSAGVPWVVDIFGRILRRRGNGAGTVGWDVIPGCATDIGIGGNGAVWIVTCFPVVPHGFTIQKFNGTTFDNADGAGTRIAVAPNGIPWVTNQSGQIFRRRSSAAGTVGWDQLPGCATDIGIHDSNYAWAIGCGPTSGGSEIFVWDEQVAIPGAVRKFEWLKVPGGAVQISVGAGSRPWIVNINGAIFKPVK